MKDQRKKAGRPATGTVVRIKSGPNAGQLQGIITLADGSRKRLPPFPPGTSEAMAEERTLAKAREALELDARKATPAGDQGRRRRVVGALPRAPRGAGTLAGHAHLPAAHRAGAGRQAPEELDA
jgi:hypothetical protein